MRDILKALGLSLVTVMGSANIALAADRALIIANTDYKNYGNLSKADRRAIERLAEAYKGAGFAVAVLPNASVSPMAQALAEVDAQSSASDRIAIHYMGHIQVRKNDSYLMSVRSSKGKDIERAAASPGLSLVTELLGSRPGQSALIIATPTDDVRTIFDHASEEPGLLVVAGPYGKVNDAVTQGLESGRLTSTLLSNRDILTNASAFMIERGSSASMPSSTTTESGNSTPRGMIDEMNAWSSAENANSHDALEAYLATYPNGMFVREAKERLAALGPKMTPEQRVEADLNLKRTQRREIQRRLTLLGFNTRGVDGIFGPGSRRAISAWQKSERFTSTGYLDQLQLRVLETAAVQRQQELDRQAEEDRARREAEDLDFWRRTGASGREAELRAYLERFPKGLFAAEATRKIQQFETDRAAQDNAVGRQGEAALGLNNQSRQIVESRLKGLGYNPGPVDGTFDGRTRAAITKFQSDNRLQATGYLSSETVGQIIASSLR